MNGDGLRAQLGLAEHKTPDDRRICGWRFSSHVYERVNAA